MEIVRAGMFWYTRETFARMKIIAPDRDKLSATFDRWLELAENGFAAQAAQGRDVVRVVADIDHFIAWTRARGLNVDAQGRTQYAAFIAQNGNPDKDEAIN